MTSTSGSNCSSFTSSSSPLLMPGIGLLGMQAHNRSTSLPCRLNPHRYRVEQDLTKLLQLNIVDNDSDDCSSSSSLDIVRAKLVSLSELHISLQEVLLHYNYYEEQSSYSLRHRRSHSHSHLDLDGSVAILSVLDTTRDIISQMKDQVRDLQSALRRRGGCSDYIRTHVDAYLGFRKRSKKEIAKGLRELKQIDLKYCRCSLFLLQDHHDHDHDHDHAYDDNDVHVLMREVSGAMVAVLKSLLISLSVPTILKGKKTRKSTTTGWSKLIMKLSTSSSSSSQSNCLELFNEVASVDVTLYNNYNNTSINLNNHLETQLKTLDTQMQGIELALDAVFRTLLQTRVSILNILTPQ